MSQYLLLAVCSLRYESAEEARQGQDGSLRAIFGGSGNLPEKGRGGEQKDGIRAGQLTPG